MTAAEVGNKAGRGWVETLLLVVSGADEREGMSCGTSRSWQEEGRWLEESAWVGHCTLMEEWEIMVCEQERQDQEAAVGSTRADTRGHEAQGFPSRERVSHGLDVAAERKQRGSSPGSTQTREHSGASDALPWFEQARFQRMFKMWAREVGVG